MYQKVEPFGFLISGEILGGSWLSLVDAILHNGETTSDEGRQRLSLQNVRIKSETQIYPDPLLEKYGNKKNIEEIIRLTFENEIMHDFDIVPSFSPGSKSYHARIKDWDMIDFVVKRLAEIPESKKAVMSFVRKEDFDRTLARPKDDYLPCITSIQFRLIKIDDKRNKNGYHLNTIFNARSIDAYQKAGGNLTAIALLSRVVADKLEDELDSKIWIGSLDGIITDAHIYEETINDAKEVVSSYKKYDKNT